MSGKEKLFYKMARSCVRELEEYDPGPMPADISVRISTNENNRGFSREAYQALLGVLRSGNRYPESRCTALRHAIAEQHGLEPEQILIGNGLDGVFTMLGRAFLERGDDVVIPELTFSVYEETALIAGANPVIVPMKSDFSVDITDMVNAVGERTKMLCFCNPNNPTGIFTSLEEITGMLGAVPQDVIFLLDEAYIEFADDPTATGISLLKKYPNLMICRTFSKIYGLAGLRIGYVVADQGLLKYIYKVREPFCVNELSTAAAVSAMNDRLYVEESRNDVISERLKLCNFFREIGCEFVPSQANFIMLVMDDAAKIHKRLLEQRIAVRILSYKGKKQLLRVSIGMPHENEAFKKALVKALVGR